MSNLKDKEASKDTSKEDVKLDAKLEIKNVIPSKKPVKKLTRSDLESVGRLDLSEDSKRDGYFYRVVDDEKPGRVEYLKKLGYEDDFDGAKVIASDRLDTPSKMSNIIETGIHTPRKGRIMRVPLEQKAEIDRLKKEIADEKSKSMFSSGIPTEFGKVQFEKK